MASSSASQRVMFGNNLDSRVNIVVRAGYADVNVQPSTVSSHGTSFLLTGFYIDASFFTWTSGQSDLSALYDFYRLDRVQVSFMFDNNFSGVDKVTKCLPYFFSAVDYNDATVTGIGDITQKSTCECVLMSSNNTGHVYTKTFTPRAQLQAYGGLSTGYAEASQSTWFNSSAQPVHYGLKWATDASQSTDTAGVLGHVRVFVKAFFSCKEPK